MNKIINISKLNNERPFININVISRTKHYTDVSFSINQNYNITRLISLICNFTNSSVETKEFIRFTTFRFAKKNQTPENIHSSLIQKIKHLIPKKYNPIVIILIDNYHSLNSLTKHKNIIKKLNGEQSSLYFKKIILETTPNQDLRNITLNKDSENYFLIELLSKYQFTNWNLFLFAFKTDEYHKKFPSISNQDFAIKFNKYLIELSKDNSLLLKPLIEDLFLILKNELQLDKASINQDLCLYLWNTHRYLLYSFKFTDQTFLKYIQAIKNQNSNSLLQSYNYIFFINHPLFNEQLLIEALIETKRNLKILYDDLSINIDGTSLPEEVIQSIKSNHHIFQMKLINEEIHIQNKIINKLNKLTSTGKLATILT